ncbi:MAG: Membrane protein [Clostridiales bacterium]|jgi:hemolysin III|nr:Membrane protein [Clostridiales bacterium]
MKINIKDPISALTHYIGQLLSILGTILLLMKAAPIASTSTIGILFVFGLSLILLYTASTVYHTFDVSNKINNILRKIDHMMIFVLIAGTYTPICLITLKGRVGWILFGIVWSAALLGFLVKLLWITAPRWVSSLLYILMGWTVVGAFSPLLQVLPVPGLLWLMIGGIIYTIGGVIYALDCSPIKTKYFGGHELFHIFVLAGSFCHFIFIYNFVI